MATAQIFDPALCCATGVCGVDVDQALVTFAADLEWLKSRDAPIRSPNGSPSVPRSPRTANRVSGSTTTRRARWAWSTPTCAAVDLAQQIKDAPAKAVLNLAYRYLEGKSALAAIAVATAPAEAEVR